MEVAVELSSLAVFFTLLLAAQAVFLLCWLAGRGVMAAVAAMRRRVHVAPAEPASGRAGTVR